MSRLLGVTRRGQYRRYSEDTNPSAPRSGAVHEKHSTFQGQKEFNSDSLKWFRLSARNFIMSDGNETDRSH